MAGKHPEPAGRKFNPTPASPAKFSSRAGDESTRDLRRFVGPTASRASRNGLAGRVRAGSNRMQAAGPDGRAERLCVRAADSSSRQAQARAQGLNKSLRPSCNSSDLLYIFGGSPVCSRLPRVVTPPPERLSPNFPTPLPE